ncbi:MAG: Imm21 family immunity protein [Kofleriaceae bacterium]
MKLDVPALPVLAGVSAPIATAFAKTLKKQGDVATMARNTRALGTLLARAKFATATLHGATAELSHALAAFGPLEAIKHQATRRAVYERLAQLEMMAASLRCAGSANDAALVALARELPDGRIRGTIVGVLRGGQIGLARSRDPQLVAFLETSTDEVVLRAGFWVLAETAPKRARAKWTAVLRAAPTAKDTRLVGHVFDQIEHGERDHTKWLALVAPLTLHAKPAIALAAGSLITKQPAMFLAYVAWAQGQRDLRGVIAVVSHQLYWAWLGDRTLAAQLVEPLRTLRARAAVKRDKPSLARLDRALKKIGLVLGKAPPGLGTPIAQVGTNGGPPLVVPAEHLAAWLGARGPDAYDSGGTNDYERACDAEPPSLIAIGRGHGVVLAEQGCDVYAEPAGLLFVASAEDAEVANAWRRVGTLVVGKRGLVVLDAAEAGKAKGVNRKAVNLAAGRYEVRGHQPAGFGGDFNAMRLVRVTSEGRRARR